MEKTRSVVHTAEQTIKTTQTMSCTTRARIEIKSDKKGEEIICSTQQRDADNTYISLSSFPKGIYTAQRTTIMYTIVVLMRRVVDGRQRSDICARYLWSEINRHELKLQFFFFFKHCYAESSSIWYA